MMAATVLWALAAVVLVGRSPTAGLRRIAPLARGPASRRSLSWMLGVLVTLTAGILTGHPGWSAAVAIAVGAAVWMVMQARTTRRRSAAHRETSRAASALALLLRTGMIPGAALEEAARGCECLQPAAAASRLGADVHTALVEVSRRPGFEGFATLAAAWQVSARTGAPVAPILTRVAETLRQEQQVRAMIDAELAAARVSSRIMALLPFVALLLGTMMGAEPVTFMGSHWMGEALLFVGVALCVAGMAWTERLARAVAA